SDGIIPVPESQETSFHLLLDEIASQLEATVQNFAFPELLIRVWEAINAINRYIVEQQPWTLAKNPENRKKLDSVLYNTCEGLRLIAILVAPVMPRSADRIRQQLGLTEPLLEARKSDLRWGGLRAGTKIGQIEAVFPRLEEKKEEAPSIPSAGEIPHPEIEHATIDDFQKLGLKAGEIKTAEQIKGSKKLLKLSVD